MTEVLGKNIARLFPTETQKPFVRPSVQHTYPFRDNIHRPPETRAREMCKKKTIMRRRGEITKKKKNVTVIRIIEKPN